jgi:hypothetical protein
MSLTRRGVVTDQTSGRPRVHWKKETNERDERKMKKKRDERRKEMKERERLCLEACP